MLHEQDSEVLRLVDEGLLVNVNRTFIKSVRGDSVTLDTGEILSTDGIVFCTGW
jgi:hypothetical protein